MPTKMMCSCTEKIRLGQTEEYPWLGKHTYAPDKWRSPYQRGWVQGGFNNITIQPGRSGTEKIPRYVSGKR